MWILHWVPFDEYAYRLLGTRVCHLQIPEDVVDHNEDAVDHVFGVFPVISNIEDVHLIESASERDGIQDMRIIVYLQVEAPRQYSEARLPASHIAEVLCGLQRMYAAENQFSTVQASQSSGVAYGELPTSLG